MEFISNLILAQEPLPAARTSKYYTIEANQPEVQLRITETTAREDEIDDLDQGSEVGQAVLEMTPNLPEGAPIEVTFELNQQGRLNITGKDLAVGGKMVTATIETNRALSAEEVAEATSRARGIKVTG